MRAKWLRIFLIGFISLGVLGIAAICVGSSIGGRLSNESSQRYSAFQDKLTQIGRMYDAFGAGKETKDAAGLFLESIPESARADNNVLLVTADGSILQSANGKFLHADSDRLNMIFNGNYAALFGADSSKYWFWVKFYYGDSLFSGESEMDMLHVVGMPSVAAGGVGQVVTAVPSPVSEAERERLSNMLSAYAYDPNPEASVAVQQFGTKEAPVYLLWFSGMDVEKALSDSFDTYHKYAFYYQLSSAGALLVLAYWLLAAVWVFLDARRRRVQPLPWALLVLLTNIVGLAVYWIVQSQQNGRAQPACPSCGRPVQKGYLYCPWCAEPLMKACRECGKPLEKEWVACPWCGKASQ